MKVSIYHEIFVCKGVHAGSFISFLFLLSASSVCAGSMETASASLMTLSLGSTSATSAQTHQVRNWLLLSRYVHVSMSQYIILMTSFQKKKPVFFFVFRSQNYIEISGKDVKSTEADVFMHAHTPSPLIAAALINSYSSV